MFKSEKRGEILYDFRTIIIDNESKFFQNFLISRIKLEIQCVHKVPSGF
jgi:hypothetical protein